MMQGAINQTISWISICFILHIELDSSKTDSYNIYVALKNGFAWELGLFEYSGRHLF